MTPLNESFIGLYFILHFFKGKVYENLCKSDSTFQIRFVQTLNKRFKCRSCEFHLKSESHTVVCLSLMLMFNWMRQALFTVHPGNRYDVRLSRAFGAVFKRRRASPLAHRGLA